MNDTCSGCAFWRQDMNVDIKNPIGHCHRFPPVATLVNVPGGMQPVSVKSITKPDDWCGEFKRLILVQAGRSL